MVVSSTTSALSWTDSGEVPDVRFATICTVGTRLTTRTSIRAVAVAPSPSVTVRVTT